MGYVQMCTHKTNNPKNHDGGSTLCYMRSASQGNRACKHEYMQRGLQWTVGLYKVQKLKLYILFQLRVKSKYLPCLNQQRRSAHLHWWTFHIPMAAADFSTRLPHKHTSFSLTLRSKGSRDGVDLWLWFELSKHLTNESSNPRSHETPKPVDVIKQRSCFI